MRSVATTMRILDTLDLGYANLLVVCEVLDRLRTDIETGRERGDFAETGLLLASRMDEVRMLEDLSLLPLLAERAHFDAFDSAVLERLSREHCEDTCYIEEIIEALDSLHTGHPIVSPDAMRFVLEGFTTGLRRHIAMERFVIQRWRTGDTPPKNTP